MEIPTTLADEKTGDSESGGFNLIWIGQALSQTGSSLTGLAIILWLKENFDSGLLIGTYFLISTLISAIVGLFSGSFADYFRRDRLLTLVDLAGAMILGATWLLAAASPAPTMMAATLLVARVLLSVTSVIRSSALVALIPELVPGSRLLAANSTTSSARQLSSIFAELLGGVLYVALGLKALLLFDAVSYLLAVASTVLMMSRYRRVVAPRSNTHGFSQKILRGIFDSSLEGFRYIRGQPGLLLLATSMTLINVFYSPVVVVIPFLVADTYGLSGAWYGYVSGCISLGILLGSLFPRFLATKGRYHVLMPTALATICVVFLAMAINRNAEVLLALFVILGAQVGLFNLLYTTVIQERVPSEFHGRMWSVTFSIGFLAGPLAKGAAGYLIDRLHHQSHLLLIFLACGIAASIMAIYTRDNLKNFLRGEALPLQ